ncbi:hypothetical protein DFH09DRAFT_1089021 [Mycena vulgaris]|nr:hypothetical protein DFH09DRAFT_1089021 [Mycena vulgaris]
MHCGQRDRELIGSGDVKDHTESKAGETNSDLNIIPRETRLRPTETATSRFINTTHPMLEELSRGAAAGSRGCLLRMEKTREMYECSEMTTGQETPQMVAAGSKEQHTGSKPPGSFASIDLAGGFSSLQLHIYIHVTLSRVNTLSFIHSQTTLQHYVPPSNIHETLNPFLLRWRSRRHSRSAGAEFDFSGRVFIAPVGGAVSPQGHPDAATQSLHCAASTLVQ